MKPLRLVAVFLIALFVFALPSNGCGPFFAEAVFVLDTRPDGNYAEYAKGRLGVPQAAYRVRHLVVAYDWLAGTGLSAEEQKQALQLDKEWYTPDGPDVDRSGRDDGAPGPGLKAWNALRPGVQVSTDRANPVEDYSSYENCLDDGFATAAKTLTARQAAYAADTASVAEWLRGQDAVFSNCGNTGGTMPQAVAASAPLWLRQDRAYQMGAAKFYAGDYNGAIAQWKTVAADAASPWHATARLVIARAMIRHATIGQATEIPDVAKGPMPDRFNPARQQAKDTFSKTVEASRPEQLAAARDALKAILADPTLTSQHRAATQLLDYVMLRLDPVAQREVLAARLSSAKRPQTPGAFRQALIDMTYVLQSHVDTTHVNAAYGSAAPPPPGPANTGLSGWLMAMQAAFDGVADYRDATAQAKANQESAHAQISQNALASWRATHSTPWLVAALADTPPGDPAAAELMTAAQTVPQNSPAWTAVTYHRLRLAGNAPATRAEIDALMPQIGRSENRSTLNLFTGLRLRSAPTLTAFLQDAGTVPAGTNMDSDDPDPLVTEANQDALCGLGKKTSEAETRLFDHDAATILNTRMPVGLLATAAQDQSLPSNLRFQVAQSAWVRAVLLQRPAVARQLSPVLTGCYPAWKQWLDKYDAATTDDDRRANGLLALMRFASSEPIVRDGEQREDGFATYSEYRDNWWNESAVAKPSAQQTPTFFGTKPSTAVILPDPPFLTAADRADAAKEVAALRAIPCASDYFAAQALAWKKDHPADARTPDILGFAERATRNGCSTDATSALKQQLFNVVQTKYPKSEWAKKYTTWDKN